MMKINETEVSKEAIVTLPAIMETPYLAERIDNREPILCMSVAKHFESGVSVVIFGSLQQPDTDVPSITFLEEEKFYELFVIKGPASFTSDGSLIVNNSREEDKEREEVKQDYQQDQAKFNPEENGATPNNGLTPEQIHSV